MLAPDYVFRGHSHAVNCVKVFPIYSPGNNGLTIISGDSGGNIFLWDLYSKKSLKQLIAHDDSVLSVHAFSATETISSSKDGSIKIWDIICSTIPSIEMYSGSVGFSNIAIDSNCSLAERWGSTVVSPSSVTTDILLWDIRENTKSPSAIVHTKDDGSSNNNHGMITALQFHSNLSHAISTTSNAVPILLSGFEDGSLSCFDMRNMTRPVYTVTHHTEPLLAIDINPVSASIITGGADSLINLYSSNTHCSSSSSSSSSSSLTPMPARQQSLRSAGTGGVRFRSDGRIVASAHWDGTVRLWDSRTSKPKSLLKPLAVLRHHREAVFAVDFASRAPFYQPPGEEESDCKEDNNGHSNTTTLCDRVVERDKEDSFGVFVSASKDGTVAVWSTLAREGCT